MDPLLPRSWRDGLPIPVPSQHKVHGQRCWWLIRAGLRARGQGRQSPPWLALFVASPLWRWRVLFTRCAAYRICGLASSIWLCIASVRAADLPIRISEIAAAGRQNLRDEDFDTPDWVEIENISGAPVNLGGWSLTETSRRDRIWAFPSTNVMPGQFLVVFASGKDRRIPGAPLHTNFKLPSDRGVVGLRGPTGEVAILEEYAPQVPGVSFGVAGAEAAGEERVVLIAADAPLRYYIPADGSLARHWTQVEFNELKWSRGRNGIGYDSKDEGYHRFLKTDVSRGLAGRGSSLYLRIPFVLTNALAVGSVALHVQYDDGFVAWLNGVQVASQNAPDSLDWNSTALATRANARAAELETIPLNPQLAGFVVGTNWLAVHVLNVSAQSSDLLFRARLDAVPAPKTAASEDVLRASCTYLVKPTPGAPNSAAIFKGPAIAWVRRQPSGSVPRDESIAITARLASQVSPVMTMRLRYRVMYGPEVELPMEDDGKHEDGAAGDGVYGATIPARVAQPGQMVRYYVTGTDGSGSVTRWPLFADRADYSAYEGTVIGDDSVKTRLPVLQMFVSKDAQRVRGRTLAAIFFNDELYDNVALGPHGQFSRSFPKPSFNLTFPRDHACRYETNSSRVKHLKLLSNYADKSKMRNTLAYQMIAAAGSVSHFAFPVRVQQNGKFYSVAEVVEHGDERFLERVQRDPQGALYKMNNNLSGVHGAQKKARKYEGSRDLANFVEALDENRPLDARAAYAYGHIDIPQCISYFVALTLISSDDHGHKNYYLYRDARNTGEWALFPWDVDLSWGRDWTGQYFNENIFVDNPLDLYRNGRTKPRNRLYNLFFEYPDFRAMYLRRLRTVMDEILQPPGTSPAALEIERRVRSWRDQVNPPGFSQPDGDRDTAAWPSWGRAASMNAEVQRILDEYLPGRRQFLFKSSRAKLFGDAIPPAQARDVRLRFAESDMTSPGGAICLTNADTQAVDLSGWQLRGAGVEYRLAPGTVLPAGRRLWITGDVAKFRSHPPAAVGNGPAFVQGGWKRRLQSANAPLELCNAAGQTVVTHAP